MSEDYRHNAFSDWLHERYGVHVRKVALRTPLGCPNRDGSISDQGCYFCDEFEAGPVIDAKQTPSVREQLISSIKSMDSRATTEQRYLAYLQSGTNTHGDLHLLHSIYSQAIDHPKVVSIAIGTRPDCLNDAVLDLMQGLFSHLDVWIELGVQTSNELTLHKIGRNHSFSDSTLAINNAKRRGFFVCAHLMLGLPGETKEDMIETVDAMNAFGVHGVKFHPLSITKGSVFEKQYEQGQIQLFEEDQYVETVADLLERLDPGIVVQRLVGGGRPEVHIAPNWILSTASVIQKIRARLQTRGSRQGDRRHLH